ncbi:MAG: hypothetical protein WCC74_00090 [Minisyncoccia bacterium]
MIKIYRNKKGFALLFAVFTASVMLLIGVSIFSVSLRELAISQSAKDSQLAFYAADSARECALYWDIKQAGFPSCLGDGCNPKNIGTTAIVCNGQIFNPNDSQYAPNGFNPNGNTFTFNIPQFFNYATTTIERTRGMRGVLPVADLILTKTYSPSTGNVVSSISTQGHNTGSLGRRLERGIYQTY